MADFAAALNRDLNLVKTSARYDADNTTWMHDSALFHKNGSIWVPTGAANPLPMSASGGNALYAGTGTAPLSGANAAALAAQACSAVVVQNDPDSTVDLMVGNSTTVVPLQLVPGQSVTIPVSNTSLVFVRSNSAATNATYNWLAV
jgi:hypothetical protein